jgi:hypothetical protein
MDIDNFNLKFNFVIVMYVPFSVFCVLFVCKGELYCCQRVSTQLRLNISYVSRRWLVITKPLPLNPQERPGTHYIGGWVGPRVGMEVCKNLAPTGIFFIPEYLIETNK